MLRSDLTEIGRTEKRKHHERKSEITQTRDDCFNNWLHNFCDPNYYLTPSPPG